MLVTIQWNPNRRELRNFGIVMTIASVVVGGVVAAKTRALGPLCAGGAVGGAFLLASTLLPSVGRLLYKGWMGLAWALGMVATPVLLGVVYFLVITPIGLALRLCGRDSLQRRKRNAPTYWREIRHRTDTASYERQF